HIIVPKHPYDSFAGICPYHGNCLEGMASGPAIEKRHGRKGHLLGDEKRVWEIEAHYLAHAMASYTLILSPERIILGGGVMKQEMLFPLIRQKDCRLMNGYVVIGERNGCMTCARLDDERGVEG